MNVLENYKNLHHLSLSAKDTYIELWDVSFSAKKVLNYLAVSNNFILSLSLSLYSI